MKKYAYHIIASALSVLAIISVVPASLVFVNNPKPPADLFPGADK